MIKATLRINGYDLTNISSYAVSYEPLSNNSVTSIDGTDYKDYIGMKRYINASLGPRNYTEMNELVYALTASTPARVTFYDSKAGGELTKDFYLNGQFEANIKHWRSSFKWFGDFSISLREVGVC